MAEQVVADLVADAQRDRREVLKQAEQLAAKDEIIQNLEPFARFHGHIKSHLESGQVVICKICGKSMQELEQVLKAKEGTEDG